MCRIYEYLSHPGVGQRSNGSAFRRLWLFADATGTVVRYVNSLGVRTSREIERQLESAHDATAHVCRFSLPSVVCPRPLGRLIQRPHHEAAALRDAQEHRRYLALQFHEKKKGASGEKKHTG